MIDPSLPFASSGSPAKLEADLDGDYQAWKAKPGPETSGQLLRKVQPILDTAIKSYAGGGSPNTHSRARLMALQAFQTYDPQRGSLKTHLLSQLQSLRRVHGQEQNMIQLPEQVALDRSHLVSAEELLRDQFGRDPSDREIADHTGLSLKRLQYIRKARPATNTGSILDETGDVYSPASTIPGAHEWEDAWLDFVYHDLEPTDQVVMDYTLGLHGSPQLSTNEIARRLGVTAGAVSQRKAKLQKLVDEVAELNPARQR